MKEKEPKPTTELVDRLNVDMRMRLYANKYGPWALLHVVTILLKPYFKPTKEANG